MGGDVSGLPMMPWFPSDFRGSTVAYTFVERALYRELLDAQWMLGKLPADTERLARVADMTHDEFLDAWKTVKEKFELVDGCFVNKKMEQHREKAERLQEQRRTAAQASVETRRKRALNERSNDRLTSAGRLLEHPSPSPSPSKNPSYVPPYEEIENLDLEWWQLWMAHRKAEGRKPYKTARTAKNLARYPREVQRAAIEQSMNQNWLGVFPEKVKLNGTGRTSGPTRDSFDEHTERLRRWLDEQTATTQH